MGEKLIILQALEIIGDDDKFSHVVLSKIMILYHNFMSMDNVDVWRCSTQPMNKSVSCQFVPVEFLRHLCFVCNLSNHTKMSSPFPNDKARKVSEIFFYQETSSQHFGPINSNIFQDDKTETSTRMCKYLW